MITQILFTFFVESLAAKKYAYVIVKQVWYKTSNGETSMVEGETIKGQPFNGINKAYKAGEILADHLEQIENIKKS